MIEVHFVSHEGRRRTVSANEGLSLMRAAVDNGVEGVVADCGGAGACATCHVYVDEEWLAKLPPASGDERSMIECAASPRPNSRLSCQIFLRGGLDGLTAHMPESQF